MRLIAKRAVFVLLAVLFLVPSFGAKPRLVGEAEAKEAGLALINLVFNANETEATVTYVTRSGQNFTDGEITQSGEEEPVYIYRVAVSPKPDGRYRYAAEVNAETGVAYYATMDFDLVPEMTAEQRKAAIAVNGNGDWINYDFETVDIDCTDAAREWIRQTFHPDAPVLGFINCGFISDDATSPGAAENFYVVLRDGTIYYLNMVWPQLTVLEFGILNLVRENDGEL